MKTAKIKVVKPKGGVWTIDKKSSLLSIERVLASLGYEILIQTRSLAHKNQQTDKDI